MVISMSTDPVMEILDELEQDWERYLEADDSTEEAKANLEYLEAKQDFLDEIQPVSMSEKSDIIEYLEDNDYENLKTYVRRELR